MAIPPSHQQNLVDIQRLLEAGQYKQARSQADLLVEQSPSPQSHYLAGLAKLMCGDAAKAIPSLAIAVEHEPDNPVYRNNLGEAHRRAGQVENAVSEFKQVVDGNPEYANAHYNLACALFELERYKQAGHSFKRALKLNRSNTAFMSGLADAQREQGKYRQAVALYKQAIEREPDNIHAHLNLGPLLLRLGHSEDALAICQQAVRLDPENAIAYQNLGLCLVEAERLDDAMSAYATAHELDPDCCELAVNIARVWKEVGELAEAEFWFAKALSIDESSVLARAGLATIALEAEDFESAIATLEKLRVENPNTLEVCLELATAYWEDGDVVAAVSELEATSQQFPEIAAIHSTRGTVLASAGRVDEAIAAHSVALNQNPLCIPALSGLAAIQRGKLDNGIIQRIEKLATDERLPKGALASLNNGLASFHDANGEAELALHHSRLANQQQWSFKSRRGWNYENARYAEEIETIMACFNTELFSRLEGAGLAYQAPVFIIGMPRSGTTLTEQILARHPQVLGIGERNFANRSLHRIKAGLESKASFLDRVSEITPQQLENIAGSYVRWLQMAADKAGKQGILRIVDKMPDNYSLLGWLYLLFPEARFIHARRDIRDIAMSCWMTQFKSIQWACDMNNIAERIRQYLRIMDHWQDVLPASVFESNYEDLVSNQEAHSRKLVDFIGLEWDEKCLEFYKAESPVRTASVTQVREAIYSRSVGRWKSYAELLAPVSALLI